MSIGTACTSSVRAQKRPRFLLDFFLPVNLTPVLNHRKSLTVTTHNKNVVSSIENQCKEGNDTSSQIKLKQTQLFYAHARMRHSSYANRTDAHTQREIERQRMATIAEKDSVETRLLEVILKLLPCLMRTVVII